jgi:hypothetical protein
MAETYPLHFDEPYAHTGHDLRRAKDLQRQLAQHRSGNGTRPIEVITEAGVGSTLARTKEGGREAERRLRRGHNGRRPWPICSAGAENRANLTNTIHNRRTN